MEFLSLEYIKQHSRIEYDCEDALLELYADAAEEVLAQTLNRGKDAQEMVASLMEQYGKVPAPIYHAGLMLVDLIYQHRTAIGPQQMHFIPYTFDMSVKPYMKLTV